MTLHKVFDKIHPTGFCWLWMGGLNNCGYGQTSAVGGTKLVHRIVYELLIEPIEAGMELDHLCLVRNCANPDHLEPVTHAENMRRAGVRNNWGKGQRKLSFDGVRIGVQDREFCVNGHEIADVGLHSHTLKSGETVYECMACKKAAQCRHGHKKNGCPRWCKLQIHPREARIPA